jgi:hypothetical protein
MNLYNCTFHRSGRCSDTYCMLKTERCFLAYSKQFLININKLKISSLNIWTSHAVKCNEISAPLAKLNMS